jgi:hypothetical protein
MVSIPARFLNNSNSQLTLLIIQLQMEAQYRREIAQSRRQNYGKAKEIYSARNKWSKILAKPTATIGAILPSVNCSCYGSNAIGNWNQGNPYCTNPPSTQFLVPC